MELQQKIEISQNNILFCSELLQMILLTLSANSIIKDKTSRIYQMEKTNNALYDMLQHINTAFDDAYMLLDELKEEKITLSE